MNKTTYDFLVDARRMIARGWCQGVTKDCFGRVCALGAMWNTEGLPLVAQKAEKYLRAALPFTYTHVARFNDSPCTQKSDVLALYDVAIANAKRRHINGRKLVLK